MTQAKREHEKSWYIHDWFETLQGKISWGRKANIL